MPFICYYNLQNIEHIVTLQPISCPIEGGEKVQDVVHGFHFNCRSIHLPNLRLQPHTRKVLGDFSIVRHQ